jgi:polyferredoxin
MPSPSETKPDASAGRLVKKSAHQNVDWSNYRDHLATADEKGDRRWMYPKKVDGRYFRLRTWLSWILLAVMFAGPFITINGNPLLMMNIVERKFSVLGEVFWPQDMMIFAIAVLTLFVSVAIFTTAFGRIFCGWFCPQTVMMEMVFRKIEYFIEGDAHQQRALNAAPWTALKTLRKGIKQAIFFALSFVVGNVLLCYVIGWQAVYKLASAPPMEHLGALASL